MPQDGQAADGSVERSGLPGTNGLRRSNENGSPVRCCKRLLCLGSTIEPATHEATMAKTTLTMSVRNMQSDSETLQADSVSRNERLPERSVMPTAGDRIAQWLKETDASIAGNNRVIKDLAREVGMLETQRRRLLEILDAINARM